MLVEWLWEIKENIDRHGIRWGLIFAFYVLFRKERRNYRLDRRDDAIFHNQKVIMAHLGLSDQFIGQASASQADLQSFKRLYSSLHKAIQWVSQLRRGRTMQINRAWLAGVVTYVLGQAALKYGFTWNDAWSDTVTDIIITFAIPLIVAFMNRTKTKAIEKPVRPQDVDPDTFVQGG